MENVKILRRAAVCAATGLSYSTIYRLERAGQFPVRRQLSTHTVGWLRDEVQTWITERQVRVCANRHVS